MSEWQNAKNILCIRLDAMGDLLMTTPAIQFLKRQRADRKITLLTSTEGALIAPYTELFDHIIIYRAPWLKSSQDKKDIDDDLAMIQTLTTRGFDGAVIFTVYSQNPLPSALMCYLSRIPLIAGFCRENPYGLLTHWIKEEEPQHLLRHEVRRHLDLVGEIIQKKAENTPLVLHARKEDECSLLKKMSPSSWENIILVHPGSTASSRRFYTEGFAAVVDKLISSGKFVIFTGAASETEIVREISQKMNSNTGFLDLSGKLSLGEFIALIKLSPLLVSNNSGPVHMAAALGTPVIDIYALTNPQHTPWMVKNRVLFQPVSCAYCYKSVCPEQHNSCISNLSPEFIVKETLRLFSDLKSTRDDEAIHPIQLEEHINYDYSRK